MLNIFILKNIMNHLLANPGVFRWSDRCDLWGIDLPNLYEHLGFLRVNGFTRNDYGRTYWIRGSLKDVREALPETFSSEPVVDLIDDEVYKCTKELRSMVFVGLDVCQIQSRCSKSYGFAIIHKAVILAGGTIAFSPTVKHVLYYKFSADRSEVLC
jgi:hypothetical protein